MSRCPDCDDRYILGGGNGKCSKCHGTGKNPSMMDDIAESLGNKPTKCWKCDGSGDCPTCKGTGEIDN